MPTTEQLRAIVQEAGLDPDMDIENVAYTVTDQQELQIARAILDLMLKEATDPDQIETIKTLQAEGKRLKLMPEDSSARIKSIKRKLGYAK